MILRYLFCIYYTIVTVAFVDIVCFRRENIDTKYGLWKFGVMFSNLPFLYLICYFAMSVLGQYNRFFFSVHLLDIAVSSKALRTILKSVTHNGKQVCVLIFLNKYNKHQLHIYTFSRKSLRK